MVLHTRGRVGRRRFFTLQSLIRNFSGEAFCIMAPLEYLERIDILLYKIQPPA